MGASWEDSPRVTDGRKPPSIEEMSASDQERIGRELRRDAYSLDNWQTFYGTPVAAFLADEPGRFPTGEMTSLTVSEETVAGERLYRLAAEFSHAEVDSIGEVAINADRGYRPQSILHEYTGRGTEWLLTWSQGADGGWYPSHAVYRRQHTPAELSDKVVSIRVHDFETDIDFDEPETWRGGAPNWYDSAQQWLSLAVE